MKAMMRKQENTLVTTDDEGLELLSKIKRGSIVEVSIVRKRNYLFHKKLFSLLNYAFENWEHEDVFYRGAVVQDDFETFRENVLIMSGYGYPVVNLRGEVRYRAKSISFASMSQETFEKLYSAVIDAILKNVLDNHSEQELITGVLNYG